MIPARRSRRRSTTSGEAPPAWLEYAFHGVVAYGVLAVALGVSVPGLAGAVLVVLAAACIFRSGPRAVRLYRPIAAPLGAAALFVIIQLAVHRESSQDVRPYVVWAVTLIIVHSLSWRIGFFGRFVGMAVLVGVAVLPHMQFMSGGLGVERAGLDRAMALGGLSNANDLAAWFGFCAIWLTVAGIESKHHRFRAAWWTAAVACLYIVALTVSRGTALAFAVAATAASRRLLQPRVRSRDVSRGRGRHQLRDRCFPENGGHVSGARRGGDRASHRLAVGFCALPRLSCGRRGSFSGGDVRRLGWPRNYAAQLLPLRGLGVRNRPAGTVPGLLDEGGQGRFSRHDPRHFRQTFSHSTFALCVCPSDGERDVHVPLGHRRRVGGNDRRRSSHAWFEASASDSVPRHTAIARPACRSACRAGEIPPIPSAGTVFVSCRLVYIVGQLGAGGAERQLVYLLRTMDRERYMPAVVVWNFSESDPYVGRIRALGVPVYGLPAKSSSTAKLRICRRLIRRLEPEVIHSYSFYTNVAAYWSARRTPSIAVGSIRCDFVFEMTTTGAVLGRLSARWPRDQICNSAIAARMAATWRGAFVPRRLSVVKNGLDLEQFRCCPVAPDGRTRIVGVGSLHPRKRWERLLDATAELARKGHDAVVQIVGDGPLHGSLQRQAQRLGIAERVDFTGYSENIPGLLAKATFLVHTSDSEGYPNAVMEAMACGRAVVATDAGDVPALVDDGRTGYVVPRGDDDTLVARMAALVSDRDLCHRMGKAARAKAERQFALDRLVSDTLAAYRETGWKDA